MGQGQSQQVDNMYTDYIQRQQQMLYQQQQQINELYHMNLNQQQQQQQQQQVPPNIAFQTQQSPDHSLRKLPSTKLDPYKVLGISKQYNETILKKAYLKKAMKAHPDRGGSDYLAKKINTAKDFLLNELE